LSPVFWEGPEGDRLGSELGGFGYFGNGSIVFSFCEMIAAAPQHPDAARWRSVVRVVAERYCEIAARNPWGLVATQFALRDTPAPANGKPSAPQSFVLGSFRQRTGAGSVKLLSYEYQRYLYHYHIMGAALFLNRAAEITGNVSYRTVAQRQLDWVMGCNPYDASAIEGVGYNQPLRGIFGEFFPPTPQIPGAVSIGFDAGSFSPNTYGNGPNEYDMPVVGNVLWLMAEQAKGNH
jgi:hypothetical protein